tara:strand:+ start:296 stop:919 length:624 start_codon:yes stop_codon:yes gene_type:complete
MEARVSNYYKPNKDNTRSVNIVGQRQVKNERKPINNTERVTPAKPIPQPIKKSEGLAKILSINDVVFPLDKTPIENWVNWNQKVHGNKEGAVTASEAKVADAVEKSMYPPEASELQMAKLEKRIANARAYVTKPKEKKDKWQYTSWADQQIEKAPKMSAKKSWQIIKQSMNKDELADWYVEHPEDKPAEYKPYKPDPYITEMLGEDY